MDESKALVSRVETQFSEITEKQRDLDANFDITMQSFLLEYDEDRLQTNNSGEGAQTVSRVSKTLAKSTISHTHKEKPKAKKPATKPQVTKSYGSGMALTIKAHTQIKIVKVPIKPAEVSKPGQSKKTVNTSDSKQVKEALKPVTDRLPQNVYSVKGPKVNHQLQQMFT